MAPPTDPSAPADVSGLPVPPPVLPMLAKSVKEIPDPADHDDTDHPGLLEPRSDPIDGALFADRPGASV